MTCHIKCLQLFNFKSFVDSHTISFHPNFTCVLGANGSGKSNLIEAICFVLALNTQNVRGSGKDFISSGKSECAVQLTFSDDITVERTVSQPTSETLKSTHKWDGKKVSSSKFKQLLLDTYGIDCAFPNRITVMQHNVTQLAAAAEGKGFLRHIEEMVGTVHDSERCDVLLKDIRAESAKLEESVNAVEGIVLELDAMQHVKQDAADLVAAHENLRKARESFSISTVQLVHKKEVQLESDLAALNEEKLRCGDGLKSLEEGVREIQRGIRKTEKEEDAQQIAFTTLQQNHKKNINELRKVESSLNSLRLIQASAEQETDNNNHLNDVEDSIESLEKKCCDTDLLLKKTNESIAVALEQEHLEKQILQKEQERDAIQYQMGAISKQMQNEKSNALDTNKRSVCITRLRNHIPGVYGMLKDIFEVADSKCFTAVNSALSRMLDNAVVCATRDVAIQVIDVFTTEKVGTVTCIIVEEIQQRRQRSQQPPPTGFVVPLSQCVNVKRGKLSGDVLKQHMAHMSDVLNDLTSGWYVCESLKGIPPKSTSSGPRFNYVSYLGDICQHDGQMQGGDTSQLFPPHAAIRSAQEIISSNAHGDTRRAAQLRSMQELKATLDHMEIQLTQLRQNNARNPMWRSELESLQNVKHHLEKTLSEARQQLETAKKIRTLHSAKQKVDRESPNTVHGSIQRLEEKVLVAQKNVAVSLEKVQQSRKLLSSISDALKLLKSDYDKTMSEKVELERQMLKVQKELTALTAKSSQLKESKRVAMVNLKDNSSSVKLENINRDMSLSDIEDAWRKERGKVVQLTHKFHMLTELVTQDAIRRYDSLSRQKDTLCDTIDDLKHSIERKESDYDDIVKRRNEALRVVMTRLDDTFREVLPLIGGSGVEGKILWGSGVTSLTEYGCSVVVRTTQSAEWRLVSTLSGGQRSIVTVALIFALQACFPAPFYIFDEVDAALDVLHVSKLSTFMCSRKDSQFICISLRFQMYEKCHHVVGVYHEGGSSRVVQVNLGGNDSPGRFIC